MAHITSCNNVACLQALHLWRVKRTSRQCVSEQRSHGNSRLLSRAAVMLLFCVFVTPLIRELAHGQVMILFSKPKLWEAFTANYFTLFENDYFISSEKLPQRINILINNFSSILYIRWDHRNVRQSIILFAGAPSPLTCLCHTYRSVPLITSKHLLCKLV